MNLQTSRGSRTFSGANLLLGFREGNNCKILSWIMRRLEGWWVEVSSFQPGTLPTAPDLGEKSGQDVFSVLPRESHRNPSTKITWHLLKRVLFLNKNFCSNLSFMSCWWVMAICFDHSKPEWWSYFGSSRFWFWPILHLKIWLPGLAQVGYGSGCLEPAIFSGHLQLSTTNFEWSTILEATVHGSEIRLTSWYGSFIPVFIGFYIS